MSAKKSSKLSYRPNPESIVLEGKMHAVPEVIDAPRIVYPFEQLSPGESFSYPLLSVNHGRQLHSIKASINSYTKHYPAQRFVAMLKQQEGLIRVWRLADKVEEQANKKPVFKNYKGAKRPH